VFSVRELDQLSVRDDRRCLFAVGAACARFRSRRSPTGRRSRTDLGATRARPAGPASRSSGSKPAHNLDRLPLETNTDPSAAWRVAPRRASSSSCRLGHDRHRNPAWRPPSADPAARRRPHLAASPTSPNARKPRGSARLRIDSGWPAAGQFGRRSLMPRRPRRLTNTSLVAGGPPRGRMVTHRLSIAQPVRSDPPTAGAGWGPCRPAPGFHSAAACLPRPQHALPGTGSAIGDREVGAGIGDSLEARARSSRTRRSL